MLAELRNTIKSRSSLRSKHLVQLEANKDKLKEIKTIAAQKLVGIDQDVSFDEGTFILNINLNLDYFKFIKT